MKRLELYNLKSLDVSNDIIEVDDYEEKIENDKILMNYIEKLNLDFKVKNTTIDIYNETKSKLNYKRLKNKQSIICACIFLSSFSHKNYLGEDFLLDFFNLSKKKFTLGLSIVKSNVDFTRIIQQDVYVDLFLLCQELNLCESDYNEIKYFINSNRKQFKLFSKTIVCCLVYIWLLNNKKIIPTLKTFSGICDLSEKSMKTIIYKKREIFIENNFTEKAVKIIKNFNKKLDFNIKIDENKVKHIIRNYIRELFT